MAQAPLDSRRYCARATVETSAQVVCRVGLPVCTGGGLTDFVPDVSCRSIGGMIASCRSSTTCVLTTSGGRLAPLERPACRASGCLRPRVRQVGGRESVLQWQVPHLGVAWGDTVNLAALDPVHLIEARKRLGVPFSRLLERRVARIPVQRIAHQPAVVYDTRSHWLNSRPGEKVRSTPPEDEFTPFAADTYEELRKRLDSISSTSGKNSPPDSRRSDSSSFATSRCRPGRHQRSPSGPPLTVVPQVTAVTT